jgi:NADPH2:quinone reductase
VRAATIRDGEIVIADHPDPEPGAGEVLVRVQAAGLNAADLLQLAGRYPAPPGSPADIPGLELAGTVAGLGPRAWRFDVGDAVMGIVGGGAQAELAVVHERQLVPIPQALALPEAGGVPEVFTTAHDALFSQCGLRSGERLLVHGAAGGVGSAAVQLGRIAGADVSATVRNPDHRDAVAALGAHRVLTPDEFGERGPFDVVLELVGAVNFPDNIRALASRGRIAIIGVGSGTTAEISLIDLMVKRATIRGSTLRSRSLEDKAATARAIEREVLPHFATGALHVPVTATFALGDAASAYERFAAGSKLGKVILTNA